MIRSQQQQAQQRFDHNSATVLASTGNNCTPENGSYQYPSASSTANKNSGIVCSTISNYTFNNDNSHSTIRPYRGSLPLKKRRFFHEIALYQNEVNPNRSTISTNSCTSPLNEVPSHQSLLLGHQPSQQEHQLNKIESSTSDERFAALALVAAATATSNRTINFSAFTDSSSNNNNNNNNNNNLRPAVPVTPLQEHQKQSTTLLTPPLIKKPQSQDLSLSTKQHYPLNVSNKTTSKGIKASKSGSPSTTTSTLKKRVNVGKNKTIMTAKPISPKPRVIHPPLSSPIPGGCHGRTSRNNSYCRRTPCYNGSKYCKLHYQQYMKSDNENNTSSSCVKTEVKAVTKGIKKGANHTNSNSNQSTSTTTSLGRNHQDKRFTGLIAGEVQCLATTTRGRPCSYVSVSGTKYCHLHADYDTNPPPRRGGGGSLKPSAATIVTNDNITSQCIKVPEGLNILPRKATTTLPILTQNKSLSKPLIPKSVTQSTKISLETKNGTFKLSSLINSQKSGSSSSGTVASPKASSIIMAGSKDNTKKAEIVVETLKPNNQSNNLKRITTTTTISTTVIHPPPPYPCLNTIPSDQWSNRYVLIGAGPLVNHIGCVMKWGNGWVTISMRTSPDSSKINEKNDSVIATNEVLHNRRAIELFLLPEDLTAVTDLPFPVRTESVTRQVASASTLEVTTTKNVAKQSIGMVNDTKSIPFKQSKSVVNNEKVNNISPNTTKVKNIQMTTKSNAKVNKSIDSTIKTSEKVKATVENKAVEQAQAIGTQKKGDEGMGTTKHVMKEGGTEKEETRNEELSKAQSSSVLKKDDGDSKNNELMTLDNKSTVSPDQNESRQEDTIHTATTEHIEATKVRIKTINSLSSASTTIVKESNIPTQCASTRSAKELKLKTSQPPACGDANKSLKQKSLLKTSKGECNNRTSQQGNQKTGPKQKKLTLMEELVLAQTGRRIKNVNLLLGSSGGRTIQRPKRYEDKTLIKKKRNRQKLDDDEGEDSPKRKKPGSSSRHFTETQKPHNKFIEAQKDKKSVKCH